MEVHHGDSPSVLPTEANLRRLGRFTIAVEKGTDKGRRKERGKLKDKNKK
jgi:hypothetical protein